MLHTKLTSFEFLLCSPIITWQLNFGLQDGYIWPLKTFIWGPGLLKPRNQLVVLYLLSDYCATCTYTYALYWLL